jgi:hypothetical protein
MFVIVHFRMFYLHISDMQMKNAKKKNNNVAYYFIRV